MTDDRKAWIDARVAELLAGRPTRAAIREQIWILRSLQASPEVIAIAEGVAEKVECDYLAAVFVAAAAYDKGER